MITKADLFDAVLCRRRLELLKPKLRDIEDEHFDEPERLINQWDVMDHDTFVKTAKKIADYCDE